MMRTKSSFSLFIRLLLCIFAAGFSLYSYVDRQNEITELRIVIPLLSKELKTVQEENVRLQYELERFESPDNLMELAGRPEFSHLEYPYLEDVVTLKEPPPLP